MWSRFSSKIEPRRRCWRIYSRAGLALYGKEAADFTDGMSEATMPAVLKLGSRMCAQPSKVIALAILSAIFMAMHNEIFSFAAWAFDRITTSYLIQYIDNIGLGIGACFG